MNAYEYAIETLRIEYYRIESDLRAVPAEHYAYGFDPTRDRERQADLIDSIMSLGGDVTRDMLARQGEVRAAQTIAKVQG